MDDRQPFPDAEKVMVEALGSFVPTGHIGTVTPPDLQTQLPFLRVQRYGGSDDGYTDSALVSIDALAATRSAAIEIARLVQAHLLTSSHEVGTALIDHAVTVNAPKEVPWSNDQTIRRFVAEYRVALRRTRRTT